MKWLRYLTTVNIAADHNQLIMELMKTIANKHDLVCLLHEKPLQESTAAVNTTTGLSRQIPA